MYTQGSSSNIWYFKAYGTARIYKKIETKKEEKQSNTTNVDKADNKKDKFFRYICLILKQSFIYKEDWSKFFI